MREVSNNGPADSKQSGGVMREVSNNGPAISKQSGGVMVSSPRTVRQSASRAVA